MDVVAHGPVEDVYLAILVEGGAVERRHRFPVISPGFDDGVAFVALQIHFNCLLHLRFSRV
jgi:hypothetical protein